MPGPSFPLRVGVRQPQIIRFVPVVWKKGGLIPFLNPPFGDGTYTGNVIQGGVVVPQSTGGLLTITGAASVAPDPTTLTSVVQCDTLVIRGSGASLCPGAGSKALVVLAKSSVELMGGGTLNSNGLRYSGNFGGVALPATIPTPIASKIDTSGLISYIIGQVKSAAGVAGTAFNAGGGGSGAGTSAGAGGTSGTFGGGSGGGGGKGRYSYGGAGTSAEPFAGAPGVGGHSQASDGEGGWDNFYGGNGGVGGGCVIVLSPCININTGCKISADATVGTNSVSYSTTVGASAGGGGGGGGGIVILGFSKYYRNWGTVSAKGGAGGASLDGGYNIDPAFYGASGAAGSVNIIKLKE